jgi:hypothetical protein
MAYHSDSEDYHCDYRRNGLVYPDDESYTYTQEELYLAERYPVDVEPYLPSKEELDERDDLTIGKRSRSQMVFWKAPKPIVTDQVKNEEKIVRSSSWYDLVEEEEGEEEISKLSVAEICKLHNWGTPKTTTVPSTPDFPDLGKIESPKPIREKFPTPKFCRRSSRKIDMKEFLAVPENSSPLSREGSLENASEMADKPKKNKVCKNWEAGSCVRPDCVFLHYYPPCVYGDRCKNPHCKYVHEEKQEKPRLYKTRICRHWLKNGKCQVQDCGFIHDLNDPAIKYCLFGDNCINEQCRFFHVPKDFPKNIPKSVPVKKEEPKKDVKKDKKDSKEMKKQSKKDIKKDTQKKPSGVENCRNIFSVLVEAN